MLLARSQPLMHSGLTSSVCLQLPDHEASPLPCTTLHSHPALMFGKFAEMLTSRAAALQEAALRAVRNRQTAILHPSKSSKKPVRYSFSRPSTAADCQPGLLPARVTWRLVASKRASQQGRRRLLTELLCSSRLCEVLLASSAWLSVAALPGQQGSC